MSAQKKPRYAVLVLGVAVARHATRVAAQRDVDRRNKKADEACGYEVIGDGAASVWDTDEALGGAR